jgi:PAS domain S-box-containing protein
MDPVGYYTYVVADDNWTWSPGIYELHGYVAHEVTATTELLLRHTHPEDLADVLEVLETAVRDGRPFGCSHRVVDRVGAERPVLVVGRGVRGDTGSVERLVGFFADLTHLDHPGAATASEPLRSAPDHALAG